MTLDELIEKLTALRAERPSTGMARVLVEVDHWHEHGLRTLHGSPEQVRDHGMLVTVSCTDANP